MQENNKESEKQCSRCKKTFLIETHFQSRIRSEGTKMCKTCRAAKTKSHNKATNVRQKRLNIYSHQKRKEIEKRRGCQWPDGCRFNFSDNVVCDEIENMVIFEFDHLEDKLFCVSDWVNGSRNEQELVDEIAKCRILCCFHHRLHSEDQRNETKKNQVYSNSYGTTQLRKLKRKNKENLHELKLDPEFFGKCVLCERPVSEEETTAFDFDHINPQDKHFSISYMVHAGYSWERSILPEIDKCRLLCAICHVLHTQDQKKNVKNVCRKRKRYKLPPNQEELEIVENGARPTKDELYELVLNNSFVDMGKMYGVSDITIINWCKKQGIPHKRRKLMEESEQKRKREVEC